MNFPVACASASDMRSSLVSGIVYGVVLVALPLTSGKRRSPDCGVGGRLGDARLESGEAIPLEDCAAFRGGGGTLNGGSCGGNGIIGIGVGEGSSLRFNKWI